MLFIQVDNFGERLSINHLTADEPMTLQEIADHFLISRERVRQIEVVALKKVRKSLLPAMAAVQKCTDEYVFTSSDVLPIAIRMKEA
jgi:hypothetical protein